MNNQDIAQHLRSIASKGRTDDYDNAWLFDAADFLDPIVEPDDDRDHIDPWGDTP